MTGRAFVETVLDYFAMYNRTMDLAIEERDVWPITCSTINEFAKRDLLVNMKLGDRNVPNQYVTTFVDVPIYLDPQRGLCYSFMPANPIYLPNRRGIKLVSPMRNMSRRVILCDVNEAASLGASPAKNAEGQIVGWQEQDRFYYLMAFDAYNAPKMMFQLLIADYSSASMDAEMPCDPSSVAAIRDDVIAYFMRNKGRKQDFTKDTRDE